MMEDRFSEAIFIILFVSKIVLVLFFLVFPEDLDLVKYELESECGHFVALELSPEPLLQSSHAIPP